MAVTPGDVHLRTEVVRAGLLTSVLASCASGLYLAATPDGPHRSSLWALLGLSVVITVTLAASDRLRLVRGSRAMSCLHAWAASQTLVIAACLALDDGLGSSYGALLFLPLVASSIGFRPRQVVAHGVVTSAALLGVMVLDEGSGPSRVILWVAAIALTSWIGSSVSRSLLSLSGELDRANRRLAHIATTDGLTGCLNRGAFHDALERERSRRDRDGGPIALLSLDIDHFKRVNDHHGHPVGDEVLVTVAHAIQDAVRVGDIVGRTGGEEFAVLLVDASPEVAAGVGERVRAAITASGATVPVTASLGLVAVPATGWGVAELVRAADAALYAAKRGGRDRLVVAPATLDA